MRSPDDPIRRFKEATRGLERARESTERWTKVRRDAVKVLVERGWSYQHIADEVGVSKARIAQIARQGR